jgi:hypothetical protein
MARWLESFPVPEEGPAHYVRDLGFSLGGFYGAPREFSEHTPWFTNMERVALLGYEGFLPSWIPSLGRLPQFVTSLTLNTGTITLTRIHDIMVQLPNLDDLSISGSLITVGRDRFPGMGTVLRGRFGGRLQLLKGHADEDIMNMLLEVPTGLHFTGVQIRGTHECLLSTVRLAEACAKTLVKLSYTISVQGKSLPFSWSTSLTLSFNVDGREAFERSFDFSKFPNLQGVDFGVGWTGGGLPWIPAALSTLRPATSPRLSAIQLNFVGSSTAAPSVERSIEAVGDDLGRVADEFARIKREFAGAVSLTVLRDPGFKAVLDTLNVSFRFCGVGDTP